MQTCHRNENTWAKAVLRFKPEKAARALLGRRRAARAPAPHLAEHFAACWRLRHGTTLAGRPTTFNATVDVASLADLGAVVRRREGGGAAFNGARLPSTRLQARSRLDGEHELLSSLQVNSQFVDWDGAHQVKSWGSNGRGSRVGV